MGSSQSRVVGERYGEQGREGEGDASTGTKCKRPCANCHGKQGGRRVGKRANGYVDKTRVCG